MFEDLGDLTLTSYLLFISIKYFYFYLHHYIFFCPIVSVAAVHACIRGSFPSGCSHLPLPPLQFGDSLHLLFGCLHHPPFHESCHLWFSGRAVQEVLDPIPGLSEPKDHQGQTGVTESEPVFQMIVSQWDF